jgi:hypothetical protein
MYPLRGALVRAINDGSRMPKIDEAHCVPHPERSTEQDMVFIVPRGEDMLLLGGLTEEDEWSLDIGLHNHQPVRDMHRRCLDFTPVLGQAQLDPDEPVRVGLRPVRNGNVCLEREAGTTSSTTTATAARASASPGAARTRSPQRSQIRRRAGTPSQHRHVRLKPSAIEHRRRQSLVDRFDAGGDT